MKWKLKLINTSFAFLLCFTQQAGAQSSDSAILIGSSKTKNVCTAGNLVGGHLLVTAAHCVDIAPDFAYAGDDPSRPEAHNIYKIAARYKVPAFSPGKRAVDIGFILLSNPIPGFGNAPTSSVSIPRGGSLVVYGYSGDVREAKKMIAIGMENGAFTATCAKCAPGDSGGPVYYKGNLIGVLSGGFPGGKNYVAPIQQSQLNWVEAQIKKQFGH